MAAVSTPPPWRWSREDFVRLSEQGYFGPESRVELIDGEVLHKMGQGNAHIYSVRALAEALRLTFGSGFSVSQQVALPLGEASQPEPDISVVIGSPQRYDGVDPKPDDVALVVEVSDSTLSFDRTRKLSVYARAGLREYWILNLIDRRLEIYRRPLPEHETYGDVTLAMEDGFASPVQATGAPVSVGEVLPKNRALDAGTPPL